MMIPDEFLLMLIVLVLGILLIYGLWRRGVTKIFQFELNFMDPGVNHHEMVRGDSLDFEHEFNSTTYKIDSDRLYRVKPGLMTRIQFKIVGINQRFIVIFQKGKKTPIKPRSVKVSSRILGEVKDSRALKKALKNEFSVPMDLKKIVIIIGALIAVVVIYLVATGQVVI